MNGCIICASRELRRVVIFDYTTLLRPFGDKIRDFVLTSLGATNYATMLPAFIIRPLLTFMDENL